MPLRAVLLKDVGGSLSFSVPEGSAPSSAFVTVYDHAGAEAIARASVTVGTTLSVSISAGVCDTVADNYRALWEYTVDGTTYRRNQPFDVVRAILYPTITTSAQLARRFPDILGRNAASEATLIAEAWSDLLDDIRAKGSSPHRIMDPAPLTRAHAALAASYIARSYRPGGQQSPNDWQAWAAERAEEYRSELAAALANVAWYDETDDLIPTDDEVNLSRSTLFISR